MAERVLEVTFEREFVGALTRRVDDVWVLEYSPAWLASPRRFPLSHSLPLLRSLHEGPPVRHFFANLLPEGQIRRLVTQRLGISEDNDFELLARIGGDCAGAVSVSPPGAPEPAAPAYRELTSREIGALARELDFAPLLVGEEGVRLSLAGAQNKLPVRIADGRILLPLGGAASTHILKLPGTTFKHLAANEVLVGDLARRVGLPVVSTSLLRPGRGLEICVVARYDRTMDATGTVRRLHQEDLCQALGAAAAHKYESEGGPTFASCFELVTRVSANPLADPKTLLDWLAFNAAVGNCDGHAKNLALLFGPSGACALAPLYDLVSTRAYPRLSRAMAMSIDGIADLGAVNRKHWAGLAARLGVRAPFLLENTRRVAEAVLENLDAAARALRAAGSVPAAAQLLLPSIRKPARMLLRSLGPAPARA